MRTHVIESMAAVAALAVAAAMIPTGLPAQQDRYDREISRLAGRADVTAALQAIEGGRARFREELVRLTEIPAPPFGERRRGMAYAEMLRAAGADSVWTDAEGNVLALRPGRMRERTVAIAGHLDTVFPAGTEVTVRERGDTLFAPGIGDDTWGLTVVLSVLRAMEVAEIPTQANVLFIATVGEEGLGDLRGMKQLFGEEGAGIDAFISVDGTSIDRITHEALGSHRYRVTVHGPGGHSWGAFGLANPHHALGRAVTHFADAADRYTREGSPTSYNVGRIGGGTSVNSVPFESWMEVDMRSESPARLRGVDSLFQAAVHRGVAEENAARRHGDSLRVDVLMIGDRPSGEIPLTAPLVQRGFAASRFFGIEPVSRRGSTDSNIPISRGIPAITIGGGGKGGNAHALDEWWYDDGAVTGIQRALLVLLAEAGVG